MLVFASHVVSVRLDRLPWLFVLLDDSVWQAMPSTPPTPPPPPGLLPSRRLSQDTHGKYKLIDHYMRYRDVWLICSGTSWSIAWPKWACKNCTKRFYHDSNCSERKEARPTGPQQHYHVICEIKNHILFLIHRYIFVFLFLSIWLHTINLIKKNTTD